MARPKKAVVDYFPHYVNHGKTMFTIENRYGNDGYAFWFKLLELLGASEHHFIDCNNSEAWEYLLSRTNFSEENAKEILNLFVRLGSIDKELWEMKVIWSENFIANLSTVYLRREVSLYSKSDVRGLCQQKLPLSEISVNINPQSKVENSIGEESEVNEYCLKKEKDDIFKIEFEVFRKEFTGSKNGLETEFKNFTKIYKNYKEIIPLLLPAIQKENETRNKANELNVFFPVSKNLSTWLSKKCWEQELPEIKPKQNNNNIPIKKKLEFEIQAEGKYDNI